MAPGARSGGACAGHPTGVPIPRDPGLCRRRVVAAASGGRARLRWPPGRRQQSCWHRQQHALSRESPCLCSRRQLASSDRAAYMSPAGEHPCSAAACDILQRATAGRMRCAPKARNAAFTVRQRRVCWTAENNAQEWSTLRAHVLVMGTNRIRTGPSVAVEARDGSHGSFECDSHSLGRLCSAQFSAWPLCATVPTKRARLSRT